MRARLLRILIPLAVATLVTALLFTRQGSAHTAPVQKVTIAVASHVLASGTVVTADDVALRRVAKTDALPGLLSNRTRAVGKVLVVGLSAGEALQQQDLRSPAQAGLSYRVPAGMLAVTLPVTSISGVGGRVRVGDRIDILAAMPEKPGGPPIGRVLISDVQVLDLVQAKGGSGISSGKPTGPYSGVTLALTPNEAAALQLAENAGSVSVALRSHGSTSKDSAVATEAQP